jgi:ABC-type lipoprotein release transport system permease subunit
LIILTVSLGIFSAFYAQTIDNNTQKNLNYLIGSDFKVFTEETDMNYSKELEKIEGVSAAFSITQTTGNIGSYLVTLIGVNPESYLSGTYWSEESIVDGGPLDYMINDLKDPEKSGIVINDFLASTLKMGIGDKLNVTGILGSLARSWNFSVSGILTSAPGVGKLYSQSYSIPGYAKFGGIILINQDLMEAFKIKTTRIFLIKVNENTPDSLDQVHQSLMNQSIVRHIISRHDINESFFDFLNVAGVAGILSIDFLISLLIAIVGVAFFYNYIITKRLKEYAILRACGGTKNQILWISISESLLVIFFGILNGFILGIGFCIGFLVMTRPRVISSANIFRLELAASPILIGIIIIIEFFVLLFAAGIAANKSRNVNVSNFLRNL